MATVGQPRPMAVSQQSDGFTVAASKLRGHPRSLLDLNVRFYR